MMSLACFIFYLFVKRNEIGSWPAVMGLNVKFPISVRGDLKISGGAFGWDKKKNNE